MKIGIYSNCLRKIGHNEQGIIAQIGELVTCYAPALTLPNVTEIVEKSASAAKRLARWALLVDVSIWLLVFSIIFGCFGLVCWCLGFWKALSTTVATFALLFALLVLLDRVKRPGTPRRLRAVVKQLNREPQKSQELYAKLQREDHALYEELKYWIQTQQKDNLRQQVAKSEKTLGPYHADTIAALNLLAKQLESMDVLDEAEAEYKRALERALGDFVVLGNYAFFLQNFRRNYAEARNLYLRALQADPTDAINHTNFAGLCLIMDNHPESEHHLREAWRLIAGKADRYTCRTLFLRAALAAMRKEDTAIYLGQLKTIFEQEGIQPISSRNTTVLDYLRKHIPADQFAMFDAIYSATNKPDGIAQLQAISAWQRVRPVPLSSPWP